MTREARTLNPSSWPEELSERKKTEEQGGNKAQLRLIALNGELISLDGTKTQVADVAREMDSQSRVRIPPTV